MNLEIMTADELWADLEGFEPPSCPTCTTLGEPTLDEDGYFCACCLEPLANGCEFDEVLEAWQKAASKCVA